MSVDAVVRRRRVPAGKRRHAARLVGARARGGPRRGDAARAHRPQPAAAQPPRRDRPAADRAGHRAGGHAPAASRRLVRPAASCRLRSRWVRDEAGAGSAGAGRGGRVALARSHWAWSPPAARPRHRRTLDRRAVPPPATSDPAKPCTKEAAAADAGSERARRGLVGRHRRPGSRHQHDPDHRRHRDHARPAEQGHRQPGRAARDCAGRVARGRQHRDRQGRLAHDVPSPTCRWLKLRSVGPNYATLKAFGGGIAVTGICISSWDDTKQQVDDEPGRRTQLPARPRRRPDDRRQVAAGLPRVR